MKNTRTKRLKRKQNKQRVIKLLKTLLKDIYYILIGMLYILLKTYVELEKAFIKVFKMMPIWFVRLAVWVMLINILVLNNKAPEIIEKIKTEIEIKEVISVKEVMVEPEKCTYGIYECAIYDEALEQGYNKEQAKIAIAVAQHETGDFKSALFKNNNNPAGLWNGKAQKFYSFATIEDGINCYIKNVGYYFNNGYGTIEKLQTKWAPLNANNDPTGLNNNWVSGVSYYYNKL